MRVLFVTADLPYPLTGGARTRNLNILKELGRKHEVTLLSFAEPGTRASQSPLADYCSHIETVERSPLRGELNRLCALAMRLAQRKPYHVGEYHSPRMKESLGRLAATGDPDIVHIDHLQMAQYVSTLPSSLPRVLDEHNAENVIFRRRYQNESNWLKKAYLYLEWRKILSYERETCSSFDTCLTVSETDRDQLRSICGDLPFAVIPNGVDIEHFAPSHPVDGARLLYVGSMGWYPNEDAICYFCESILPLIRREMPEVDLTVAGGDPSPRVQGLARDPHVQVTGFVEDLRPYLADATVFIAPIRVGSGTRLKILEALAAGLPVVSTSVGCEGLDLTPDRDIVIADDPAQFARRTLELLRDSQQRLSLSQHGRRAVEAKYSWRRIVEHLQAVYEETIRRKNPRAGAQ